MSHHAYVVAGDTQNGTAEALRFVETVLGLATHGNPDVTVLKYELFSVDDARTVAAFAAQAPVQGEARAIVISAHRLFHEAQNALLKLFEEPSAGMTLILVVPSEGMLLPTLRSRLQPLPKTKEEEVLGVSEEVRAFMAADRPTREQLIEKMLAKTKSDKNEEKQASRAEILQFVSDVERAVYTRFAAGNTDGEVVRFLGDLERFIPILHERSAPLKPILEHLLIAIPHLKKASV